MFPLSARGQASIILAPPWHYSGDTLAIESDVELTSSHLRRVIGPPEEFSMPIVEIYPAHGAILRRRSWPAAVPA